MSDCNWGATDVNAVCHHPKHSYVERDHCTQKNVLVKNRPPEVVSTQINNKQHFR